MKDNCIYGELWATRNRPKVLLGRAAVSRTAIDKVSPATPPRGWPAAAGCMGETPGAVAVGGSDLLALHRTLQAVGDTQAQILAELRTREPTSAAHVNGSSHHNHPRLQ